MPWQQQSASLLIISFSSLFPFHFPLLLSPTNLPPAVAVNTFVRAASEGCADSATSAIQCQRMKHLVRGIIRRARWGLCWCPCYFLRPRQRAVHKLPKPPHVKHSIKTPSPCGVLKKHPLKDTWQYILRENSLFLVPTQMSMQFSK